jgi:glycosyltransferase involved in cell wall biosynthesis
LDLEDLIIPMNESVPEISIIVPLYNEEDNVSVLYQEIRNAVDFLKKPYEILFIDDGSSDSTVNVLKKIIDSEKEEENRYGHTRLIKFSRNFGQTPAMQAGFDYAQGDVIVSMDGDLQNDPKDIPKLLNKVNEGYDVVCGWRRDRKDKKVTRIIPSKVANWLIGKITGVYIHDNGCSLKAYRNSIIKSVRLYSDMHRFIPAMTSIAGARITEIVVNHRPRKYGETKYGLSRIWKVLFDMVAVEMLVHFNQKPLKWFLGFGFIFFIIGICFAFASVIFFIKGEQSIIFPSASFLSFFLFGSLLSWGFLAEYFVKIEKR